MIRSKQISSNIYYTKWKSLFYEMRKNVLYEMSKFLMDFRIYILPNGNCMVTILKSILYEMKNN